MENIGKYTNLEKIGQGGMGVVYKGHDPFFEEDVAIKVMSTSTHPELKERFFREARVARQLDHPNIVQLKDLAEQDDYAYIVMELLDGEDLQKKIDRNEKIELEDNIQRMIAICAGLSYVHKQGIVHRDIKPGNIQITSAGIPKLLDFGLARIEDSNLTKTGAFFGTPNYMSPEQVRGAKNLDLRSDIFSLGAVLYEMVTYRKAFEVKSIEDAMRKIGSDPCRPMQEINPHLPAELSLIIDRALEKKPDDRYGDLDELIEALEGFQTRLAEYAGEALEHTRDAVEKVEALRAQRPRLLEQRDDPEDIDATVAVPMPSSEELPDTYLKLIDMRERAERELDRMQRIIGELEWVDAYPIDDLGDQSQEELDAALQHVDMVLRTHGGSVIALALRDALRAENEDRTTAVKRRRVVVKLLKQVDALRTQGQLEEALKKADKAKSIAPDQPEVIDSYAAIEAEFNKQQEEKERERKAEQAEELLHRARQAVAANDLTNARALAKQLIELGLEIDAANAIVSEAEQLEAQERARIERQQQIEKLLAEARRLVEAGEEEEAQRLLRQVLELDSGEASARMLRQQIDKQQEQRAEAERKRQEKLNAQLTAARDALRTDKLPRAKQIVTELLVDEPDHENAKALLAEIDEAIARAEANLKARRERDTKVSSLLRQARTLEREEKEGEALGKVREVLDFEPENEAALQLETRIEQRIRARQEEEEQRKLEAGRKRLADEQRKREEERQRQEKIAQLLRDASAARQRGELGRAGDLLTAVLAEEAGHEEATALLERIQEEIAAATAEKQAERERRQKTGELLTQARALDREKKDREALAILSELLELAPANEAALALEAKIERQLGEMDAERRQQEKTTAALGNAREALDAANLDRAHSLTTALLAQQPDLKEAKALLDEIEAKGAAVAKERESQLKEEREALREAEERARKAESEARQAQERAQEQEERQRRLADTALPGAATPIPGGLEGVRIRMAERWPVFEQKGAFYGAAGTLGLALLVAIVLSAGPLTDLMRAPGPVDTGTNGAGNPGSEALVKNGEEEDEGSGDPNAITGDVNTKRTKTEDPINRRESDPDPAIEAARQAALVAQSDLITPKSNAAMAGAPSLARDLYGQAEALEREAINLMGAESYEEATDKFEQAADAYVSAEGSAVAAGDDAARQAAVDSRNTYNGDRSAALAASAAALAPQTFARAENLASQGEEKYASEDFEGAEDDFGAAAADMRLALSEADRELQALEGVVSRFEIAYGGRNFDAIRQLWPALAADRARGLQYDFEDARSITTQLTRIGDIDTDGQTASLTFDAHLGLTPADGSAAQEVDEQVIFTLTRGGDGWLVGNVVSPTIAPVVPLETRRAVRKFLDAYELAIPTKDAAAIRGVWPDAPQSLIDQLIRGASGDITLKLEILNVDFTGSQAEVRVASESTVMDRGRPNTARAELTFVLEQRGERWVRVQ